MVRGNKKTLVDLVTSSIVKYVSSLKYNNSKSMKLESQVSKYSNPSQSKAKHLLAPASYITNMRLGANIFPQKGWTVPLKQGLSSLWCILTVHDLYCVIMDVHSVRRDKHSAKVGHTRFSSTFTFLFTNSLEGSKIEAKLDFNLCFLG